MPIHATSNIYCFDTNRETKQLSVQTHYKLPQIIIFEKNRCVNGGVICTLEELHPFVVLQQIHVHRVFFF